MLTRSQNLSRLAGLLGAANGLLIGLLLHFRLADLLVWLSLIYWGARAAYLLFSSAPAWASSVRTTLLVSGLLGLLMFLVWRHPAWTPTALWLMLLFGAAAGAEPERLRRGTRRAWLWLSAGALLGLLLAVFLPTQPRDLLVYPLFGTLFACALVAMQIIQPERRWTI